jgi:hypothetical protein
MLGKSKEPVWSMTKNRELNRVLNYKKEIGLYLATRIALTWVWIKYLNPTALDGDISILYYYGTHPLCLITGSFTEGARTAFGAYAPLEPLIYAPFTAICNSLDGVRLAIFTLELLTLLMMILIGNKIVKEDTLHKIVLIYILIPLTWAESIVWVQDEILAALFLLVVLYFKLEDKEDLAALSLGLTCIFSKIIPLIIFVPLLLTANNKKKTFLLTMLPILAVYLPVNYNYGLLGIGSPFIAQMQSTNMCVGSLAIPYLFELIIDSSIQRGVLSFLLISASLLSYYTWLLYKCRGKDVPNFIDMSVVSFLIFFIFFWQTRSEYYIYLLPILLLRLGMLEKINIKETLLLLILSISSISWKISYQLNPICQYRTIVSEYAASNRFFEFYCNLIGNQFFKLEEIIFLVITLVIVIRYLIFFLKGRHSLKRGCINEQSSMP